MMRWLIAVAMVALAWTPTHACPFCGATGQTLTQDANMAGLILLGTPRNARLDPEDPNKGTTDYDIELVVKSHEFITGKTTITLPRYIPLEKGMKYVVFCDIYKGALDPYRGFAVRADSRIGEYIKQAIAITGQPVEKRLRFAFDYLDDADPDVSNDALTEFGNADYKDFRRVAEKLPADKVKAWLNDPSGSAARTGFYASMLGHCGKPEDAGLLRAILDDSRRRYSSNLEGVIAAYTLLQPQAGREFLKGLLSDRKRDFLLRYAGLRSLRFFVEFRPDVIGRSEAVALTTPLLAHGDIADMAVEDLGKWQAWGVARQVLTLLEADSVPFIVKKAVLKYALRCPPGTDAGIDAYLAAQRKADAENVDAALDLLKSESQPPAATAKPLTPRP